MENQSREISPEVRILREIFNDVEIYAQNYRLRQQRNLSLWLNIVLAVVILIILLTER